MFVPSLSVCQTVNPGDRCRSSSRAAAEIFRLFPSEWTVRQQQRNAAATSFWRTAIPNAYRERETGDEVIQAFKVDPL